MKLIALVFLFLLCATPILGWFGGISRSCDCKAVSDTVHLPFHKWSISSCKLCSCKNPAMVNCEKACADQVKNYALTGCGKTLKGSKTVYKFDAGGCWKGVGREVLVCQ